MGTICPWVTSDSEPKGQLPWGKKASFVCRVAKIPQKRTAQKAKYRWCLIFFSFFKKKTILQNEAGARNLIFTWEVAPHTFLPNGEKRKLQVLSLLLFPILKWEFNCFYTKSWLCLYFFKPKGFNYCPVKHQKWLMLCIFASYTFSKNWSYSSCPRLPFHSFIRFCASPFTRRKNEIIKNESIFKEFFSLWTNASK